MVQNKVITSSCGSKPATRVGRRAFLFFLFFLSFILSSSLTACSESEDEETIEFSNWQARNEAFWATLEDSLKQGDLWKKIKCYSKDAATAGNDSDYIYVRVLAVGEGQTSPLFNDSVRYSYRGRLLPSTSYADGYVFDQTYLDDYSRLTTGGRSDLFGATLTDGFATALLHMHQGDFWRVYVPYQLGYGAKGNASTIPGYSTLIFDISLIDISAPGEALPAWGSRRK